MAEDRKLKKNVEHRDENKNYEAPKLEVLGTVDQVTSEFDGNSETPK